MISLRTPSSIYAIIFSPFCCVIFLVSQTLAPLDSTITTAVIEHEGGSVHPRVHHKDVILSYACSRVCQQRFGREF